MNRIDRLFGILVLLQSRKHLTAEKIASQFAISERTVYRDMRALLEQGIPLTFDAQKGYIIMPGYFLPPVSFTNEEANALLLMERFLAGFSDKSISNQYKSALDKVKAVLRSKQRETFEHLDEHIKLQLPNRLQNDFDHLSQLQTAIANKTQIFLSYKNNKQETSERKLEPIGLIFYAFSWHLIGYCHLRSSYRDFKVSQILSLQITSFPFIKSDHISLNDYMKQLPVDY